jgi:hypothetical protein
MQLAKTQAGEIDSLVQQSAAGNATYYKELQVASHSVVDCLMEGLNKERPEQFQKNFLVIARSFNAELGTRLLDCLTEKHLSQKKYTALSQANKLLESKLISFTLQLQNDNSGTTTVTAKTKS